MNKILVSSLLFLSTSLSANEWSGNVSFEYKAFNKEAAVATQFKQYGSVSVQPEWYHQWDDGSQIMTFVPFARWDEHDAERTHSDIRELSWLKVFDDSELRVGIRKVFWGVSESQHLVDVINQSDAVEGIDGEEKLGQPMINYALINDWGTLDLFILPYFRERTFPGVNGRLRSSPHVDTSNPVYESSDKENHVDYAARWVHSLDSWDIGLSYFNGTSRDPSFTSGTDAAGNVVLRPVYNQLQQAGVDLQATMDAWLWKMEYVNRNIKSENYNAATLGFEYTFYGVFDSASDVGLVMEYLYDDRKTKATTPFEDDVMLGLRWVKNDTKDTSLLFGVIADRNDRSRLYSIEASRRIAESWKLNIEARVFDGFSDTTNPLYALRNDDFVLLELGYYF